VGTQPVSALDGRLARSVRTRTAVIDALLQLYEEGDLSPTAVRVAGRAGVALRTVYGHFADMESLYAEAGQRELSRLVEISRPIPPELPYEERVRQFAANRRVVLEWLLPIMRAAAMREQGSPQLQRNRDRFVALGDAEVRQVFAAELATLPARRQVDLVHALHMVAGGPAWVALRVDRGLGPEDAGRLLHEVLAAVLTSVQ
jgi:TetR/AcrR family transcriptional regulator of autoinduction and epiphytic fitness